MKASEGKIGRVFVLRLENDDIVPDCIEDFAKEQNISVAQVTFIGGIYKGNVVVGPRKTDGMPPDPMTQAVGDAHEVLAAGLIAPDVNDKPVLHIHGALGRAGRNITGCLRKGVNVWLVAEAIIYEILGVDVRRLKEGNTGFELLQVLNSEGDKQK